MVLQTQFADIKGNDLYIDGIKASRSRKAVWHTTLCYE